MIYRVTDRLKFSLERLIQRGAFYQMLVVAGLIVLVAVIGGLLAWAFSGAFADPATAIWWAFLRLTDPGYLGDDEGTFLRVVSTVVTILGYVLFMGSLIAILTQGLSQTMRRLESGLTPITLRDHVLILGWTNRTPSIVRELMLSEGRVRRFLSRRGARKLRIVILTDEVDAALRQELRDALGTSRPPRRIIFRSGSSMRVEHLQRVAFASAAAILLPGADYQLGGAAATDTRVIKTLLSIGKYGSGEEMALPPTIVAEILDTHKVPIAQQAYPGPIHVIASDAFISRLVAQNVRHRGLSYVYAELLSHAHGNEIYIRHFPDLAGKPYGTLVEAFPHALLLGFVRPEGRGFEPFLNPTSDFAPEAEDRFVLIAGSYEQTMLRSGASPVSEPIQRSDVPAARLRAARVQERRRILILGWSHKVTVLIREFAAYEGESFVIDVLSVVPVAERAARLVRGGPLPERVEVRHHDGDYTVRADLERTDPGAYDNIVLVGSDWLESGEEADARTILGYVLLRAVVPADGGGPEVLVELVDPANARLFRKRTGEVIISPVIVSHMLAHAALRQELTSVFAELFGPGGAEIFFRPVADFGLAGQTTTFRAVQRRAVAFGEVALGVRLRRDVTSASGGVQLNPDAKTAWGFEDGDEVVVLTRMG